MYIQYNNISIDDLKEPRLYIHSLIDEEISKLNDPEKVFLVDSTRLLSNVRCWFNLS